METHLYVDLHMLIHCQGAHEGLGNGPATLAQVGGAVGDSAGSWIS